LFGLFAENGPYRVNDDQATLSRRNETWGEDYALLYIDNPFGTGFSHTVDGYVTNEEQVGENLLSLLAQFMRCFPEKQGVDLYVTGESYAGHYVPALAYAILNASERGEDSDSTRPRIKLAGIAIGDGWVDPINMIPAYPELFSGTGLADGGELARIQEYCGRTVELIKAGNMAEAFHVWDEMISGDFFPYPIYFQNITGLGDVYNYLNEDWPAELNNYHGFVQRPEVKAALHAGADTPFGTNAQECFARLISDFHVSMAPRVEALLDAGVKVMMYAGQLDVQIGAALVEAYLPKLQWKGQSAYMRAPRTIWRVGGRVAGYVRRAENLVLVTVRSAGHILPYDQPEAAKVMIANFVEGSEFGR